METTWFDPNALSIDLGVLHLSITWYSLSYIAGFLIAYAVMVQLVARESLWKYRSPPMEKNEIADLLSNLVLGVIIGGRLGYVIFYMPQYYIENPLEVIKVWNGGMSFHGGFIGVIIAGYFYCVRKCIRVSICADLIAVSAPPGLFLGRLANFINGELWGRPTESMFGIVFPGELAAICKSEITASCARHPSQLYEAVGEGLLLFLILIWAVKLGALKRPGLATGIFASGYGLTRYLVEFVRVPDQQFFSEANPYGFAMQFGSYGVTMGQMLSIPMIVAGFYLILNGLRYRK